MLDNAFMTEEDLDKRIAHLLEYTNVVADPYSDTMWGKKEGFPGVVPIPKWSSNIGFALSLWDGEDIYVHLRKNTQHFMDVFNGSKWECYIIPEDYIEPVASGGADTPAFAVALAYYHYRTREN